MISREEVKHIAALARIGVDEKDIDKFTHDLSAVLDWIEQLKEVDVSGVEPTAHITGVSNISREDALEEFSNRDSLINLFPDKKDNFDKVKSIL